MVKNDQLAASRVAVFLLSKKRVAFTAPRISFVGKPFFNLISQVHVPQAPRYGQLVEVELF